MEPITLKNIEKANKNTLMEHLGIEYTQIDKGRVVARMPIDHRTVQSMQRLHGGATVALAESVGGVGSQVLVDLSKNMVLGVEVSASHVGTTLERYVYGIGRIIHEGKSSHVWEIRVEDSSGNLISLCRLTNRILPIKNV